MILDPSQVAAGFRDKKIRVIIAGYPGIGKTTLALSAPSPLYIDTDLSADRIDANVLALAKGVIIPKNYEELTSDLGLGLDVAELESVKANLSRFESIVIDTGGKLQDLMADFGTKRDSKYRKRDGSLSQTGYGWLHDECNRLASHIIYNLQKHVVFVFHATEGKDGEETKLRIKAKGSFRDDVWEFIDLGGFMEMHGTVRTIGFSNCERYYAKGTRGVNGIYNIPDLTPGQPNDFLTRLFRVYIQKITEDSAAAEKEREAYDRAMTAGRAIIEAVTNAAGANDALAKLRVIEHALTSRAELAVLLKARAKQLGLRYDRSTNSYIDPDPKPAQPAQEEVNA